MTLRNNEILKFGVSFGSLSLDRTGRVSERQTEETRIHCIYRNNDDQSRGVACAAAGGGESTSAATTLNALNTGRLLDTCNHQQTRY